MRKLIHSIASTFVAGLLVVVPVYLAVLLLLKAMQSLSSLVKPVARFIPDWLPAEGLLSLLRTKHVDILNTIRDTRDLSDETAAKLKAVVEGYAKSFT